MEKSLGKDYTPAQRLAFLKDNCDKVEELSYMKRLTPEELKECKDALSETDIVINDVEEEKKELIQDIKARLTPLKQTRKQLLRDLKQKARFEKEQCYKFVDQEERAVGFYNSEGDLVEYRQATADELQGTIFMASRKTGTDN